MDDHPVQGAALALEVMIDLVRDCCPPDDDRLNRAQALVSKKNNADMYLDWCIARAWSFVVANEIEAADAILVDAMNAVKLSTRAIPRGTSILPFQNRSLLSLLRGETKVALEPYIDFDRLGIPGTVYAGLIRRCIEFAASDENDSEQCLSELVNEASQREFSLLELDLTLDLAILRFSHGQRTQATRMLHDALQYAVREDAVIPFIWRAEAIRPLLISHMTTVKSDYTRRAFVQRMLKHPAFASSAGNGGIVSFVGLTPREKEILKLAMEGLSRQEIAAELFVGETTVKSHLSHMYAKLGVKRFKELLSVASELGL